MRARGEEWQSNLAASDVFEVATRAHVSCCDADPEAPYCTCFCVCFFAPRSSSRRKIKSWMAICSRQTLLNETWDDDYRQFLVDSRPVVNSGIVGGRRSTFVPALHAIVQRLEAHRRAAPQAVREVGADMLLVNWAALVAQKRSGSSSSSGSGVVSGYPWGPVNWPMWAKLPSTQRAGSLCPRDIVASTGVRSSSKQQPTCDSQCGYEWLNATLLKGGIASYWFGHKLPRSWLNRLRMHACYPAESATAQGIQGLARAGAGKFRCECQVVSNNTRRGSPLSSY
jgi:hypothetical protein